MIVSAFEEGIMPCNKESVSAVDNPVVPFHTCDMALVAREE